MTVSVIMPVYNTEPYLSRAIESVLAQTFRDFELILIDDGSADHSGSVCDSYARLDPRVFVVHQQNGGLSRARNTGIETASGDFVCFIDSDDYIFPNTLETLVSALRRSSTDALRCGRFDISHAAFQELAQSAGALHPLIQERAQKETRFDPGHRQASQLLGDFLLCNQPYSVCTTLFRSNVFESIRFWPDRYCEDAFFWLDFCEHRFSLQNIADRHYVAIKRAGSITSSPNAARFSDWACAHRRMFDYFEKHGDSVPAAKCYERVIAGFGKSLILCKSPDGRGEQLKINRFLKDNHKYLLKTALYQNCNFAGKADCLLLLHFPKLYSLIHKNTGIAAPAQRP